MEVPCQFAYRAQRSVGLIDSAPSYSAASAASSDPILAKVFKYAPNGQLCAYIVGTSIHILLTRPSTSSSLPEPTILPLSSSVNLVDLAFSPSGSLLFTWERLRAAADGEGQHRNLRVWRVGLSGQGEGGVVEEVREVGGFTQKGYEGWQPLVNGTETHLIRLSGPSEISIFQLDLSVDLSPPSTTPEPSIRDLSDLLGLSVPIARIRTDAPLRSIWLSPTNPASEHPGNEGLAVWTGENKGQPASMSFYPVKTLIEAGRLGEEGRGGNTGLPQTNARKNFFKGNSVQVKWNKPGNMALFLTQSDVDNSGKSYYGETNLYLMSLDGQFESKVTLDKEGAISDYAWNPNGREFAVCYGFMPARTVLFDTKANQVHSFGALPRNFLSYQPQGRLFLLAGFGNISSGLVEIYDLKTRKKLCEFFAPNSTTCEWSPDGRSILTGTLSPRLRVDNGVKAWWCDGTALHTQPIEELYQVTWRPGPVESFSAFPATLPPAPAPSASVAQYAKPVDATAVPKPTGAYRPPGARGTLTPSIFKREDEGGAPAPPPGFSNGPATFGPRGKGRQVPGAPPPGAENGNGMVTPPTGKGKKGKKSNGSTPVASLPGTPVIELAPPIAIEETPDPEAENTQKKIRNLSKKLKAISDLKDKRSKGDTLEATQIKKIESEKSILDELAQLEASVKK